jgi:phosphoserine phosphatase
LIRWQLYHAVFDAMVELGFISPSLGEMVAAERMNWKERRAQKDFSTYERSLIKAYNSVITKLTVDQFNQAVELVFAEYKNQTYVYTRDLINELKKQGYLLFALSGSQIAIVKLLADYYGFDDCAGSVLKVKDGYFTGAEITMRHDRKLTTLKKMIDRHNAAQSGSLAIGDSDGDVAILQFAETAIAFNPTKELFKEAQARNWTVVVERKNIIYRLEPYNGEYLLKV